MWSAQSTTESAPCLGLNAMSAGGAGADYFVVHREFKFQWLVGVWDRGVGCVKI
jgi:hypothetical protein